MLFCSGQQGSLLLDVTSASRAGAESETAQESLLLVTVLVTY